MGRGEEEEGWCCRDEFKCHVEEILNGGSCDKNNVMAFKYAQCLFSFYRVYPEHIHAS